MNLQKIATNLTKINLIVGKNNSHFINFMRNRIIDKITYYESVDRLDYVRTLFVRRYKYYEHVDRLELFDFESPTWDSYIDKFLSQSDNTILIMTTNNWEVFETILESKSWDRVKDNFCCVTYRLDDKSVIRNGQEFDYAVSTNSEIRI